MNSTPTRTPVRLADVLAYRNSAVVRRYCKEHGATPEEGREVFRETLKWLYLCNQAGAADPDGFACVMFPEIEKIDWMWHTFLLFTRDYADFCERYFGVFLHHIPNEAEEEEEESIEEGDFRAALARQYAFVYDVLGEETLTAWYDRCQYAAGN